MFWRAATTFLFLLLGSQANAYSVSYVEIAVYRCVTDTELSFGAIGKELWGPNWHYIEHLVRCSKT